MSGDTHQADNLLAQMPAGERLIWQGRPSATALALRAFHIREVALYFALLMLWRSGSAWMESGSLAEAARAVGLLLVPALSAFVVLALLAWLNARASQYTITNRRVLLRFGVALPITMNIPFKTIGNAVLKTERDGTGNIGLTITGPRSSFVLLWPHVRPWHLRAPEPMLRCVPDAERVAGKLTQALAEHAGMPVSGASLNSFAPNAATGNASQPAHATVAA